MNGDKVFPFVKKILKIDSPLSKREEGILKLISNGKTSEQIAAKLGLSYLTVKVHRRNMMRKLGVNNSSELVSKGLQLGLL